MNWAAVKGHPGRTRRGRGGESGFTLIELMISAALMSLILGAAYACFSSGMASQRLVEGRVDLAQQARVALGLMTAELRSATPLSEELEFLGMDRRLGEVEADNLDFATHHYGPRRSGEGDFCEVSYYLVPEATPGLFGLWRRRQPGISLDPLSGGEREEMARGLRGLRFEYYDGLDWYDEWGDAEGRGLAENTLRPRPNLIGMPEAVRITLWFEAEPKGRRDGAGGERGPPVMFQAVARLNLAPLTWGTGAGGSGSEGGTESTGQGMPVTPGGGTWE